MASGKGRPGPTAHGRARLVRRAAALLVPLLLLALAAPGMARAQGEDLTLLRSQVDRIDAIAGEIAVAVERQQRANALLAERLDTFDPAAATEPVTLESLRQVQFDVSIAEARIETIGRRIEVAQDSLAGTEVTERALVFELQQDTGETLERLLKEARLDLVRAERRAVGALLPLLRQYRAVSVDALELQRERLAIERSRMRLDAIEGLSAATEPPILPRLRLRVAELNQRNIALSNEAAAIAPSTPQELQRRNLLQLAADEALMRSNARLVDLDLVRSGATLDVFAALVEEPAVPLRLLEDASERVERIRALLLERRGETEMNEQALADLAAIARTTPGVENGGVATILGGLDELARMIDSQKARIAALLETIPPLLDRLGSQIAAREAASLGEREVVRFGPVARGRILSEARELPAKMWQVLERSALAFAASVRRAPDERVALFGVAALAIVAVAVLLRQRYLPRFIAGGERRLTALPLEVLRRNVLWLVPAAVWAAATGLFAVPRDVVELGFAVLLVPAVAGILSTFFDLTLMSTADERRRGLGRTIKRLAVASTFLIAIVVIVYTILGDTFVLPSTRSWINRLVFLSFIIGGLPLFLMARYFTLDVRKHPNRTVMALVLAGLSLVPPVLLIGIGVVGLLGYVRLATELFRDFATLTGVLAVFALAVAFQRDLLDELVASIRQKDPARAYFVRSNFARPLNRAGQILLAVVAALAIIDLFDLTGATPVIREVLAVLSFTLFTIGETRYTVGSVVVALIALLAVFWIGGWSRRVSYTVLYRRIRDLGIRQSLSVFTQYVVIVIGLLLTLSAIGFDVTTLTVFAASLGVGIGFGLQNVVNNFISGILILIERPLRIGDIVTVSANTGTVDAIGIRSLRLRTFDEYDVIVPNSAVISDTFVNWSRTDKVIRQLITIGISYADDPHQACDIVRHIVETYPPILDAPAPSVTVDEFADSAVNLRVAYYVELGGSVGIFDIRNHVFTSVWYAFREAGITIPFPQRDVHIIPAAADTGLPASAEEAALREADRVARKQAAGRARAEVSDEAATEASIDGLR